jgi:hypothetical protein
MGRIAQWREVYLGWKEAHPNTAEREGLVRGCIGKFAYPNFWWAYLAARRLDADKGGKNNIYACEICQMTHIGRYRGKQR